MIHWLFLFRLNCKRLAAAIAEAERRTSGEIRIYISRRKVQDPLSAGREQFERLGMTRTAQRNGVLLYIAPRSRKFAVLGDTGVHEKCGDAFWQGMATALSSAFRQGRLTEGLEAAVQTCASLLAEHFPRDKDDSNELPDEIVVGR